MWRELVPPRPWLLAAGHPTYDASVSYWLNHDLRSGDRMNPRALPVALLPMVLAACGDRTSPILEELAITANANPSAPLAFVIGRSAREHQRFDSREGYRLGRHDIRRPRNLHRILDALRRRTLAHVRLQSTIHLVPRGVCGQTQRVVHMDFREQDDPVHDFVGAFRYAADGVVRYLNPAHLQCAVKSPE